MKKIILIGGWLVFPMVGLVAQVAKKTMVEHFTNTKCSICAIRNPGYQNNLNSHPEVSSISIHPSSPYATCFLSLQNTSENDARTNYYGVFGGTPRLVINGDVINAGADYADPNLFTPYIGTTPITISIEQQLVAADSIQSSITVKRIAAGSPVGNASIFAGLVEDTVFQNGGNGELKHYNVLRNSLFAPQGMSVMLPTAAGDSLVIIHTEFIQPFWNQNRLKTIVILQDPVTKDLIQSELSTTDQINLSGMDNLDDNNSFKIYPNPASQTIQIEANNSYQLGFQIFNSWGELIMEDSITESTRVDVQNLPNGIYYVNWDGRKKTKSFIIQH